MGRWQQWKEAVKSLGTVAKLAATPKRYRIRNAPSSKWNLRTFQAGESTLLTAGWNRQPTSINSELRRSQRQMVARSRDAEQNIDYAKKFIAMVKSNVVGPKGIILQSKLKFSSGRPMKRANQLLEESWKRWAKSVDVTGKLDWPLFLNAVVSTLARDGEVLIRRVRGWDNEMGYALQVLECDFLDFERNELLANGHRIEMGVEQDQWGKAVAYHLLTENPSDPLMGRQMRNRSQRVSADEMLHVFIPERIGSFQARGIPWMHAALLRLNHINGYEEAEVVAARVGASKMGFFTSADDSALPPPGDDRIENAYGSDDLTFDVSPGQFRPLPPGIDIKTWDPNHPNSGYKDFMKTALRGASSGLLVSYNNLASDLEGVNFSSIRQGTLDERDMWRIIQAFVIQSVCEPIAWDLFGMGMVAGTIPLETGSLDKIKTQVKFQPRGWPWVDPLKDVQANKEQIEQRLKSRQMILAEQGIDFEDVVSQLAEEQAMMQEAGLPESVEPKPAATAAPVSNPDHEPDPEQEEVEL